MMSEFFDWSLVVCGEETEREEEELLWFMYPFLLSPTALHKLEWIKASPKSYSRYSNEWLIYVRQ